ncbi:MULTISPECIES: YvrJ family protein [Lysinibacillus]|uniref:YvrJ family protein n=1 Tax=Lysinibacillus TaxID=400634 RepID=UPI00362CB755
MLTETSEWIMIIGNLGFPIAITIYLFIRFEKKIENLEQSINYLSEVIKTLGRGCK